jgi:hypothetical protein
MCATVDLFGDRHDVLGEVVQVVLVPKPASRQGGIHGGADQIGLGFQVNPKRLTAGTVVVSASQLDKPPATKSKPGS